MGDTLEKKVAAQTVAAVKPVVAATNVARLGMLTAELPNLAPATQIAANFRFGEVTSLAQLNPVVRALAVPDLGAIAGFTGSWAGHGFNTIFRPNSPQTPTVLPVPAGGDNILELNLTEETLSFSAALGSVPNRGMVQADAFLNGIPYLQSISDVTVAGQVIGIHAEPGLWMAVPPTQDPAEVRTYARMASIPHGTTISAQGTSRTINGPPTIPPVSITPIQISNGAPIHFPSQTAAAHNTARIPQDLTPWITAGTITQAMLDDPNTVLRRDIAGQTITQTIEITISTQPSKPLFGGGTDNIAFLLGDPAAQNPNANAARMTATFWIETVQHVLHIPVFTPGQPPLLLPSLVPTTAGGVAQHFLVTPPHAITAPRTITFTTKQIQYTQTVMLDFKGLHWPHVSVATLTPSGTQSVPPSAWA